MGVNVVPLCPVAELRASSLLTSTMFCGVHCFKLLFHRLLGTGAVMLRG